MKLIEVFTQLSSGELSQIFVGQQIEGEITDKSASYLIPSIILGVTALHTRFTLKEGRVSFTLSTLGDVYNLQRQDIIKIEQVITQSGRELPLNNSADIYSCSTPTLGTLRVPMSIINKSPDLPDDLITDSLEVVYRANHEIISVDVMPEYYEVDLPYSHLLALLYFVASRVHNPIGMVNEFHAGSSWAAKYEQECARLELQNIQVDNGTDYDRISRNGWV